MKGESEASIQHLGLVSDFAAQLAKHGIAVYRHTYDNLSFGSWEIIAGTRRHRVRLTWDGKESYLEAASCEVGDSESISVWKRFDSKTLESVPEKVFRAGGEMVMRGCARQQFNGRQPGAS